MESSWRAARRLRKQVWCRRRIVRIGGPANSHNFSEYTSRGFPPFRLFPRHSTEIRRPASGKLGWSMGFLSGAISKVRKGRIGGRKSHPNPEISHFCLYAVRCFARIARVKFAASLLLLTAFAFTACNNLVTRRSQYRQAKASGPYTEARRTGKLPTKEQLAKARATPRPTNETTEELLPQP